MGKEKVIRILAKEVSDRTMLQSVKLDDALEEAKGKLKRWEENEAKRRRVEKF